MRLCKLNQLIAARLNELGVPPEFFDDEQNRPATMFMRTRHILFCRDLPNDQLQCALIGPNNPKRISELEERR